MNMLKTFPTHQVMDEYISSKIQGSFSIWDMMAQQLFVSRLKPGSQYLEIGTQFGKSSATAVFQSPEGVKFYFCDIMDQPKLGPPFEHLLSRAEFFEQEGLNTVGTYILGDSKEVAKTWKNGMLDMIFIDGDHSYPAVKADILSWSPFLKSGGFITFHDYDIFTSPAVQDAVNELVRDSGLYKDFFYAQKDKGWRSSYAGATKI
jgi:predicted O-methyltransferase YrrM